MIEKMICVHQVRVVRWMPDRRRGHVLPQRGDVEVVSRAVVHYRAWDVTKTADPRCAFTAGSRECIQTDQDAAYTPRGLQHVCSSIAGCLGTILVSAKEVGTPTFKTLV